MEKGNQLIEKLSKAYTSLPDNELLKVDIFVATQDLEKNEDDQLARIKLAYVISQYLLTHRLKTESEVIALYNEVADGPERYKGNTALAIMLGSLFHP